LAVVLIQERGYISDMKRVLMMPLVLAGGYLLLPPAQATLPGENPFKSIVTRNSFGLIPPPPPAPVVDPTPPPSNIKLTGITTILGIKNALLMVQEPGPSGKSQSYILTEGQREGQIEVLAIDSIAGTVKVSNAGNVATLTFDKDGLKAPAAPAAVPGSPGIPGGHGGIPIPGRPPIPGAAGVTTIGSGTTTAPGTTPTAFTPGIAQPSSSGGLRSIPSRSLRLPQSSAQLNAPAAESPEVQIINQAIMMEAHRNTPGMPPMPPTFLTPTPPTPGGE